MSKFGGFTAFTAEAAIWVAGVALVAGAAGAHWDMPKVDVGGLVAVSSPSPSGSHAPASPTPTPRPTPTAESALVGYLAMTAGSNFQYSADITFSEADSHGLVVLKGTGNHMGAGQDCSYAENLKIGSIKSEQKVMVGSSIYTSTDGGGWSKSDRKSFTCPLAWYLTYTGMVQKGTEKKYGVDAYRLEVSDKIQFSSYFENHSEGLAGTLAKANLIVWVKRDGTPIELQLTLEYNPKVQGVTYHDILTEDYLFTKFSGVTITAPI